MTSEAFADPIDAAPLAAGHAGSPRSVRQEVPKDAASPDAPYDGSVQACVRPTALPRIERFALAPRGVRWPATPDADRSAVAGTARMSDAGAIADAAQAAHATLPASVSGSVDRSTVPAHARTSARSPCGRPADAAASHHFHAPPAPCRAAARRQLQRTCDAGAGIQGFQPRTGARRGAGFKPLAAPGTSLGVPALQGLTRSTLQRISPPLPSRSWPYRAGRCRSLRVSMGRTCDALVNDFATSRPRAFSLLP